MPKVLVELSGGVDSAVCALLLKNQGYELVGACMDLHESVDAQGAKNICKQLDIEFRLIEVRSEFTKNVIDYFASEYRSARTPNPCIMCNKTMKFGIMYDVAKDLACDFLATGHYARIVDGHLYKATDTAKDQSYVLHFLTKEQLTKTLLPLGEYTKNQIRQLAKDANLSCAEAAESQDICFCEDGKYADYIKDHYNYNFEPGDIVDEEGHVLGTHNGLINYTIGQRKGLGVALGEPTYVCKLDSQKNQVILGNVSTNTVHVKNFKWIEKPRKTCETKLRYRQKQIKCQTKTNNDIIELHFDEPITAPAPGQFAVLYEGDLVLGGGTIC
ncbi:MAG: tRNA 2-thiouridine(34) synthase MnmA [Coriobacteriia bacterium]|nr:tRNA 2-thiouridine(34) synthase MnmA [Coriobacteriia bacterium]